MLRSLRIAADSHLWIIWPETIPSNNWGNEIEERGVAGRQWDPISAHDENAVDDHDSICAVNDLARKSDEPGYVYGLHVVSLELWSQGRTSRTGMVQRGAPVCTVKGIPSI